MRKFLLLSFLFLLCSSAANAEWTVNKSGITDDDVFLFQDTSASAGQKTGYISGTLLKNYVLSDVHPGTLTYTDNASPSASDLLANKYICNYGSTGTIAVTLPGVSYEISRAVVVESAQVIQVTPPAGEAFDLSGTTLTAGQSFAGSATVGSKVVITRQRNAAGSWIWSADVVRGTWAGI